MEIDEFRRRGGEAVTRRTWRDRWPAAPDVSLPESRLLEPERMERTYGSVPVYQRDAAMLAKDGWQVISVDVRGGHERALRSALLSWFMRRHAVPTLVVAYRRLR